KSTARPLDVEIRSLLQIVDQGYDSKAWHGPNLRGSIRGLSPELAAWRPGPRRHSIWEIVVHAAYWKYAVRRLLTGQPKGSFAYKGSNWFRWPDALNQEGWHEATSLLALEHSQLRSAIRDLPPRSLHRKPSSSKYTRTNLLYGIASHDIYHAGQIQLVKRLY